jgi:serine/threonine-protein kinase
MANVALHNVRTPVLKVLDFGISRALMDGYTSQKLTSGAGTLLWMAPEQGVNNPVVRPATDLWSVGLLAFWLLTGKYYWPEANARKRDRSRIVQEITREPLALASVRARELGVRPRTSTCGFSAA